MTDILSTDIEDTDGDYEVSLRPSYIGEFIGQEHIKENLSIFINAAKGREESLDHVLLYGPPGLGKTTIAQIIAREMGVNFKTTAGPLLSKAGDLAAILSNMQENEVLFIDEIHRLPTAVEEVLYSAMEDFTLDIVIGEGPAARTMRINLPRFTLVGATTRLGLLSNPLRDRFGIPLRLNFYEIHELSEVMIRGGEILGVKIDADGATEIARRSRGTPRIALRMLKRVRDFLVIGGDNIITQTVAANSLAKLQVDKLGLDSNDYRYVEFIADNYQGGPVGIETISAALSEHKDAIEDTVEPYLMQIGFMQRTPRGRVITAKAIQYFNQQQS